MQLHHAPCLVACIHITLLVAREKEQLRLAQVWVGSGTASAQQSRFWVEVSACEMPRGVVDVTAAPAARRLSDSHTEVTCCAA